MFELYAKKNQLESLRLEPVTSGSLNVCRVKFEFSDDWKGLTKTALRYKFDGYFKIQVME